MAKQSCPTITAWRETMRLFYLSSARIPHRLRPPLRPFLRVHVLFEDYSSCVHIPTMTAVLFLTAPHRGILGRFIGRWICYAAGNERV